MLKAAQRNKLKESQFALPKERKYPVNDPSHARNALARASQAVNAGRMSVATEGRIRAKAKQMLKKKGK